LAAVCPFGFETAGCYKEIQTDFAMKKYDLPFGDSLLENRELGPAIGGRKAARDAIIKSRRRIFWCHAALTLCFSIVTVCFYKRGDNVLYPGGFLTALYALLTLALGGKIQRARSGFFPRSGELSLSDAIAYPPKK
jgi:hypothetical protein